MRYPLFLFPLLILGVFQLPWKEFKDYEGKFSILVPGDMLKKEIPIETAIGNLVYHSFYYQPTEKNPDNLIYMLSYCDYPEGGMHSDSLDLLEEFFAVTMESAVESVKGELLYSNDIKVQGYPAKLWRLVYKDGKASIKTKVVMANKRFYVVQTVGYRDKGINPKIDKYLDSFRLLEED